MAMSALKPGLVHEALVYASDEEFLARVVPFLRDGIATGQPAIAVVTPKKIALLREALGQDAQRVSFTDASTHYRRPAHAIAEYRRQLDVELSRPNAQLVRVIGEVQFGPTGQEHAEWTRYESMLNRGFAGYPAWVICPYDTRALPEQVVADALHTHPFVSTSDQRDTSAGYIETDELVERPLIRETDRAASGRDPLAQLTVTRERDLDDLRRVVAGAARAAGLAPRIVDDVAVAAAELVRDGLRHGEGEVSVQLGRDGARWHCEVTDRDSNQTTLDESIGLSIARLISERVEVASEAGAHTVRLTFAGASDARQRILDAASELFYQNGIRATGINTIISHSGVAKATFFHRFPAKEDLVIAWLQQPASRWFDRIRTELDAKKESPASRLLTFFDLLGEWFAQDDFRGCAFQNAAAETPQAGHPVRQATLDYTLEIKDYLRRTANAAGLSHPVRIAEQLHLLAQGAIATAVATRSPDAAKLARAAAKRILAPPA
jgi:AcrR family transcriptional regulator/anti-sigma regulatory factor (Ser/Thr protein kinase)